MPINGKSRKRVETLFVEMKQAVSELTMGQDPPGESEPSARSGTEISPSLEQAALLREVDALQARVRELEAKVKGKTPVLYEKEQVGFAFVEEQILPVQGDQLPVPPDAEMIQTPLVSGGAPIGEVKIAQPNDRSLTNEEIDLANAVAQQASVQIENLRLLAAAERARVEAQEATRQFTQKNWDAFLDAIHKAERIGFVYDQAGVEPSLAPAPEQHDHLESVQIFDEQIGRLFIKADANRPLTEEDKELIQSIARQVGQQVENIRLLADAARARIEAEEANRRLTRQNWESYVEQREGQVGFVYDSNQVLPLEAGSVPEQLAFEHPLAVRGEPIGQLAVIGKQPLSAEAKDLAAAIASQASIHLEALRLTEELQERARRLQELDRLKSSFLANMSHELRTPLNSILGFADVMLEELDGPLTENMNTDLRLIQKNGQHLLHLINDVLDMAKIEAGRMSLNPESFRVVDVLEDVISITTTMANEKVVDVFVEKDSDPDVKVFADRTRIRQVLINLVTNALKFTERGQIRLHTSAHDNLITIRVKDTGTGIPPEKLEDIFQEFTQVDTSTTRKVGGTGLGLPISRRLIEMHGGRLWAESTGVHGEGSTLFVELPVEAIIHDPVELEKVKK